MPTGTIALSNAFIAINGVDLSADVTEASLNYTAEILDATAMGAATRVRKGSLKVWTLDVTFNQDYRSGGPDATVYPLVGTTTCVEIRPVNACATASNPIYTGIAIVGSYPPVSGRVGALVQVKASFQSASVLSRASSS